MADEVIYALVRSDLATLKGKQVASGGEVAAAKGLTSFEARRARVRSTLGSLGVDPWRQSRLIAVELGAVLASFVAEEARELAQPPPAWQRTMRTFIKQYVNPHEPFSLNLMNLGLNACQFQFFRTRAYSGPVLDLGSGNGYVSALLLRHARHHAVVSDLLPSCVLAATRQGFAATVGLDMHRLPYPDGSFPTIVSIHSVDNAGERERTLREVYRVLEPGGVFCFTDFLPSLFEQRPLPRLLSAMGCTRFADHYQDYVKRYSIDNANTEALAQDEYRALLERIGFQIDEMWTFFGSTLFAYCYLVFDLELALRGPVFPAYQVLRRRQIAGMLHAVGERILLPLIYHDLCNQTPDQTQVFFRVRRPGTSPHRREQYWPCLVCPQCHGPLRPERQKLVCAGCRQPYPLISDIPLLFPEANQAFDEVEQAARSGRSLLRRWARRGKALLARQQQ